MLISPFHARIRSRWALSQLALQVLGTAVSFTPASDARCPTPSDLCIPSPHRNEVKRAEALGMVAEVLSRNPKQYGEVRHAAGAVA